MLDLPGANPLRDTRAALDGAALKAYGFAPAGDLLSQILELNGAVASSIREGRPATPPD